MEDGTFCDTMHMILMFHLLCLFLNFELKTEAARSVLPDSYTRNVSAQASAIAKFINAAFLSQSFEQAGMYMEQDLFHEPYRLDLIPENREL